MNKEGELGQCGIRRTSQTLKTYYEAASTHNLFISVVLCLLFVWDQKRYQLRFSLIGHCLRPNAFINHSIKYAHTSNFQILHPARHSNTFLCDALTGLEKWISFLQRLLADCGYKLGKMSPPSRCTA